MWPFSRQRRCNDAPKPNAPRLEQQVMSLRASLYACRAGAQRWKRMIILSAVAFVGAWLVVLVSREAAQNSATTLLQTLDNLSRTEGSTQPTAPIAMATELLRSDLRNRLPKRVALGLVRKAAVMNLDPCSIGFRLWPTISASFRRNTTSPTVIARAISLGLRATYT